MSKHWRGPLLCGCTNRKHYAFGLCNMHYQRKFKWNGTWRPTEEQLRGYKLRENHGISIEDYNAMLAKQGNACAICGCTDPRNKRTKHFHIDHSHITGTIRGLLCGSCNVALGHMKDDTAILRKAIVYLENSV